MFLELQGLVWWKWNRPRGENFGGQILWTRGKYRNLNQVQEMLWGFQVFIISWFSHMRVGWFWLVWDDQDDFVQKYTWRKISYMYHVILSLNRISIEWLCDLLMWLDERNLNQKYFAYLETFIWLKSTLFLIGMKL